MLCKLNFPGLPLAHRYRKTLKLNPPSMTSTDNMETKILSQKMMKLILPPLSSSLLGVITDQRYGSATATFGWSI